MSHRKSMALALLLAACGVCSAEILKQVPVLKFEEWKGAKH